MLSGWMDGWMDGWMVADWGAGVPKVLRRLRLPWESIYRMLCENSVQCVPRGLGARVPSFEDSACEYMASKYKGCTRLVFLLYWVAYWLIA